MHRVYGCNRVVDHESGLGRAFEGGGSYCLISSVAAGRGGLS